MHHPDGITPETLRAKLLHPIAEMIASIDALSHEFDGITDPVDSIKIIQSSTIATKQQVQLAVDTFAAGDFIKLRQLNHDILSPSSTALSYCYFMLEGLAGNIKANQRERIMKIGYQIQHIRRQLMNLLDYGRLLALPSEGTSPIILKTLLTPNIVSIPKSDSVTWDVQSELPEVMGNRRYAGNIIINLLVNALQSAPDGTVSVSVKQVNQAVVITVNDTGCGMSEEVRQKILTPFYQAQDIEDQLGIGLTVASEQLKLMNSALEIESIEKKGTKASFKLPIITKR